VTWSGYSTSFHPFPAPSIQKIIVVIEKKRVSYFVTGSGFPFYWKPENYIRKRFSEKFIHSFRKGRDTSGWVWICNSKNYLIR